MLQRRFNEAIHYDRIERYNFTKMARQVYKTERFNLMDNGLK